MRTRRRSAQRGFTLIELMIVVLIIAILSVVMFGLTSTSVGGANSEHVANDVTVAINYARMRAVSTRSYHQVEVFPNKLLIWQAWNNAVPPGVPLNGLTMPTGPNQIWKQVTEIDLPSSNVSIWNAQASADPSGGQNPAQNAGLDFKIYFKPDGSSTSTIGATSASTLFVSDIGQYKKWRILVYAATGSSYARNGW